MYMAMCILQYTTYIYIPCNYSRQLYVGETISGIDISIIRFHVMFMAYR